MSEAGQKFVLWSKTEKHAREGAVLDIDTGVLRRDHVLVLRSPQAEITLGLGATAVALIDFAQSGKSGGNALLDACEEADEAIARGDLVKSRALGIADVITTIEDRSLRRLALVECFLGKASPDDPIHPGYPAGTSGGRGGQFMPKDESPEAVQELKRLKALREFRAATKAALVLLRTALTEEIPVIDIATSINAAIDLGRIAIELDNDEDEINKAIEFVRDGPYSLDDLQPRGNGNSFSSFADFKKISILEMILRAYAAAGDGKEWHHIVEQGGDNKDNFSAEQLQSTKNIVPLPGPIHDLVTAEYAKEYDTSGKSVREWLSGQSFDDQWNAGVKILRNLGIVK
ncbi:MAG TPA: hypothetical protein VGL83_21860 [Stellaceae bacterium]|jgi:hypothetical protein